MCTTFAYVTCEMEKTEFGWEDSGTAQRGRRTFTLRFMLKWIHDHIKGTVSVISRNIFQNLVRNFEYYYLLSKSIVVWTTCLHDEAKQEELSCIQNILYNNRFPLQWIKNCLKTPKKISEKKRKWFTFNVYGKETYRIATICKNTNLGISYKTKLY